MTRVLTKCNHGTPVSHAALRGVTSSQEKASIALAFRFTEHGDRLLSKCFILIAYSNLHHSRRQQSNLHRNICHAPIVLVTCLLKMTLYVEIPGKRRRYRGQTVFEGPIRNKIAVYPCWQRLVYRKKNCLMQMSVVIWNQIKTKVVKSFYMNMTSPDKSWYPFAKSFPT